MSTTEKEFWLSLPEKIAFSSTEDDMQTARFRFSAFLRHFSRDAQIRDDADLAYAARLVQYLHQRHYHEPQRFCMAVSMEVEFGLTLHVSLPWFLQVPLWEAALILQHEVRHLTMYDLPRGRAILNWFPPERRAAAMSMVINPAADCAVNSQLLVRSPHMMDMEHSPPILPDHYDLPRGKSTEWYARELSEVFDEAMSMGEDIINGVLQTIADQSGDPANSPGGGTDPGEGEGGGSGDTEGGADETKDGEGGGGGTDAADEGGEGGGSFHERLAAAGARAHKEIEQREGLSKGAKRLLHNGVEHMLSRAHIAAALDEAGGAGDPMEEIKDIRMGRQLKDAQVAALKSMVKSNGIGSLPLHLKTLLDELTLVKDVPWDQVLRQHVKARMRARTRRTMTRPSRHRFAAGELGRVPDVQSLQAAFPGKYMDRTHAVLFCVDVSGSMNDEEVLRGMQETYSMLRSMPGIKLYVAQMDTQIAALQRVGDEAELKKYVKKGRSGHGGTSCNDLVKLVRASWGQGKPPVLSEGDRAVFDSMGKLDAVVYFTDGYLYFPKPDEMRGQYSWIWCLTSSGGNIPDQVPGVRIRVNPV